jgi:hypothetical protein
MELWQMTRAEYVASQKGKRFKKNGYYNRLGRLQQDHEDSVANALSRGHDVPERVYSEYPRLVKMYGKPDPAYLAFKRKHGLKNNPVGKRSRFKHKRKSKTRLNRRGVRCKYRKKSRKNPKRLWS